MSHGMANIHSPAEQRFPPTGTVLAVRIVRLLSTLLGVAMIILVYKIALLIIRRKEVAILALCITAFNPKFIHISSVITNDIAVACAFTLALYFTTLLITDAAHSTRRFALLSAALGLSIGLSALSKFSGLAALMPGGVGLIWYAVKHRRNGVFWRDTILGILACGAALTLVSGWYFLYNWQRYGDPLAWVQVQQANAFTYRVNPLTLSEMLAAIPMLFRSYWGIFGDGIQAGVEYDLPMWIIAAFGAGGVLIAGIRRRIPREVGLLLIAAIATLIAFVSWMRMYAVTDNSRLLMPMTATISILLAIGLLEWFTDRLRTPVVYLFSVVALMWALFIPTVSLLPNYNPITYLTPQQVTELPADSHVVFENGIEVYSAVLKSNRIDTGQSADVSVYWRATRPITESYATVLEGFDDTNQSVGRLTTEGYLGRQFVTPEWQPGRVLKTDYKLIISTSHQTLVRIFVGMYSPHTGKGQRIEGKSDVSTQIATVKVRSVIPPEQKPVTAFASSFGDSIRLEGYTACSDSISFYWRSTGTPGRDYTVFVHALDQQGNMIGQSDAPVFYPTAFWDAGEQIIDAHPITGFGKAASINMGIYDSVSKERLTATRLDGMGWTDNVVNIPVVQTTVCP